MFALKSLPKALEDNQALGLDEVQLVDDPNLVGLVQQPTVSIPGLGCFASTLYIAYWLSSHRLLSVHPPPAGGFMLMQQWCERSMPNFPIFIYDNVIADFIFVRGCRRIDGFAIVFFPNLPHWSIAILSQEEHAPHAPLVYFGNVPLDSPDIYWHFDHPTPSALTKQSLGLACRCPNRCHHEGIEFQDARSVAFGQRGIKMGGQLVVIAHKSPYSRGRQDHLFHRELNHVVVEEREDCWAIGRVDLSSVQFVTLSKIRLALYKPFPDYRKRFSLSVFASLFSTVNAMLSFKSSRKVGLVEACPVITVPKLEIPRLQFSDVRSRLVQYVCGETFWQYFRRVSSQVLDACRESVGHALASLYTQYHYAFSHLTTNQWLMAGGISLFHVYVFHRLRTYSAMPRLTLGRTWLPTSLTGLPFSTELVNRTALGTDALACRNLLKRSLAEYDHPIMIDPIEVERWIDNVTSAIGTMPVPAFGQGICHSCMIKRKLKRLQCASCRSLEHPPVDLVYFGLIPAMYPLVEQHPIVPPGLPFRTYGARRMLFSWDGVQLRDTDKVASIYDSNKPVLRSRGLLCGPMWLGVVVRCFPSTIETTLVAAAVRMAVFPAHVATRRFWDNMLSMLYILPSVDLEPVTSQAVLDNQRSSEKRKKLEDCFKLIDEGFPIERAIHSAMTMGAFTKLEKHCPVTLRRGYWAQKSKLVPRLINNPKALLNALMSVYTLPVLDWLHNTWSSTSNVFYAGCSNPQDLNVFLTHASVNRHVLEDDVSMMDGSHSVHSQNFFRSAVLRCFRGVHRDTFEYLLRLCQSLKVTRGKLRLIIVGPNPSGVPVTSLLNSITTAFVRICALYYAYTGVDVTMEDDRIPFSNFMKCVYCAVAGDDGCVFLPASYAGTTTFSSTFMSRYIHYFSLSGFDVGPTKIRTHLPHQWRLHTFLAMRPYWSGDRYEYGVEISRRMKSMFWMLDKNHHPLAWGRGVALSLYRASRHVPVVSDICRWYLSCTRGVTTSISIASFTNPYSSVYGYEVMGDINDRCISEFCIDYDVSRDLYQDFLVYLWSQTNPLINLDHPILWAIAQKE